MNKFQKDLMIKGYCDYRGAAFCATATILPNGYGMVALCVKDNILNIYEVDMKNNIGDLLYEIKLSKIINLKIRAMLLSQVLKFEYDGEQYSFTNFIGVKPALKVIEEESKR